MGMLGANVASVTYLITKEMSPDQHLLIHVRGLTMTTLHPPPPQLLPTTPRTHQIIE